MRDGRERPVCYVDSSFRTVSSFPRPFRPLFPSFCPRPFPRPFRNTRAWSQAFTAQAHTRFPHAAVLLLNRQYKMILDKHDHASSVRSRKRAPDTGSAAKSPHEEMGSFFRIRLVADRAGTKGTDRNVPLSPPPCLISIRTDVCDTGALKGSEFLRKLQRLSRHRGVRFQFESGLGKGSHGRVWLDTASTTVKDLKKELGPGLLRAMCRDLGN
jgi:mRNA interferase HicA